MDQVVQVMEDEDGWGIVGMAIQGSCGHREREAVVRAVVGRWGLEAGPRQGRDKGAFFSVSTPLELTGSELDTITYSRDHFYTTSYFIPLDSEGIDFGSDRKRSDAIRPSCRDAKSRGN